MNTRSKEQLVDSILKKEFYQTDSKFYISCKERLAKLPMSLLEDFDTILSMRVVEAKESKHDV